MKPTVICIAQTVINWNALIAVTTQILGRSITMPLERASLKVEGIPAFISSLGEFQEEGLDPLTTQREAGNLLRHASVTFLVSANREALYEISMNGPVAILDCPVESFVVMSANLQDWRNLILNLCCSRTTTTCRVLGTEILLAFDGIGLSRLFENYSRRTDHRGGLLLVQK